MSDPAVQLAQERVEDFARRVQAIRHSLHEVVVGQDATIDQVKALASAFRWKFARVQFTPDLMPADITGYELQRHRSPAGAARETLNPAKL
jgi:MoxR-like ATPase